MKYLFVFLCCILGAITLYVFPNPSESSYLIGFLIGTITQSILLGFEGDEK